MIVTIQETDSQAFVRVLNGLIRDGHTLTKCYSERRWRDFPISVRGWVIVLIGELEKNPVPVDVTLQWNFGPVQERPLKKIRGPQKW